MCIRRLPSISRGWSRAVEQHENGVLFRLVINSEVRMFLTREK